MMRSKLARLMSRNMPRPRDAKPAKPGPRVIEDKTTELPAPPHVSEWIVVMIAPRCEDTAMVRLREAGFIAWMPRLVNMLSSARLRKSVFVNRPLWPRYVLVHRPEGCTTSLADVWSIGSPIIVGVLSGYIVDKIYARESSGEFDCRNIPKGPSFIPKGPSFADGAEVETLDGLLRGIVQNSDEERVVVLFKLLNSEHNIQMDAAKLRAIAS